MYTRISGLALFLLAFCAFSAPDLSAAKPDLSAQRAALASSGRFDLVSNQAADGAVAHGLAQALGIPAGQILEARYEGAWEQAAALTRFGAIEPRGEYFAVLGTGDLDASARPGIQVVGTGTQADTASLVLTLQPAPGARDFTFRYQFVSAEYPFTGGMQPDEFVVYVTDGTGRSEAHRQTAADPDLVPATSRKVADTGFSLLADSHSRLEGEFRSGSVAAGISPRWQYVTVSFDTADTIEVEFVIRDAGDGLLDSAVMLDSFAMSPLKLEAAPDQTAGRGVRGSGFGADICGFLSGLGADPGICGTIDLISNCLAIRGDVSGAVADGHTKINARLRLPVADFPMPDQVTFKLDGASAPQDGGLGQLDSDDRLDEVTITDVEMDEDGVNWVARAQYFVPEEYGGSGKSRLVNIRASWDSEGTPVAATGEIDLRRPALILMHGWNSDEGTWDGSALVSSSEVETFRGNYGPLLSWASFKWNLAQPAQPIANACESFRKSDRIAMSQVDYLGHSMGGILGRNFIGLIDDINSLPLISLPFIEDGIINKLITLNTPHTGSPLANILWDVVENIGISPDNLPPPLNSLVGGAIEDLQVGSEAINAISATDRPSHAIYGTGGATLSVCKITDGIGGVCDQIEAMTNIDVETLLSPNTLFGGADNDAVVSHCSQRGGLPDSAITQVTGKKSLHWNVTGSNATADIVLDVLNAAADGSKFGQFPAPSGLNRSHELAAAEQAVRRALVGMNTRGNGSGMIEIVAPQVGTTVEGNSIISVNVQHVSGNELAAITVTGTDEAGTYVTHTLQDQAPFDSIPLFIPEEFAGELRLNAVGRDTNDTMVFTDEDIPIQVVPNGEWELQAVEITSDEPFMTPDNSVQLTVIGDYGEGFPTLNITFGSAGTTYTSSPAGIVDVSPDGLVQSLSPGEAVVTANNGGHQDEILVTVLEPPSDPIFNDRFEFDVDG